MIDSFVINPLKMIELLQMNQAIMERYLSTIRRTVSAIAVLGCFAAGTFTLAQPPIAPPRFPPRAKPGTPPQALLDLKSLFRGSEEDRIKVLNRLRDEGKLPENALSRLLGDDSPLVRLESLMAINPQSASPDLLKKLQQRLSESDSSLEKILSARAILESGSDNAGRAKALEALSRALHSRDDAQSNEAAQALEELGGGATSVLVNALGSESASTRRLAADTLKRIGVDASDATTPLLQLAAGDSDASVRATAADAAARVGNDSQRVATVMVKSLAVASPEDAASITDALASLGKPAVGPLTEALSDPRCQYWSVLALAEIGQDASSAEDTMAALLSNAPVDVASEVLIALPKIGASKPETVAKITSLLERTDPDLRCAATFAIARIGVKTSAVETALQNNLGSDDLFLRSLSAWAIAKLNPRDPRKGIAVMKTLGEMISKGDSRAKEVAALMLADLKADLSSAAP